METGPNKTLGAEFTFLDATRKNIKSIGLVFEPKLFMAYGYADPEGRNLLGYANAHSGLNSFDIEGLKKYEPLYALNFEPAFTLVPKSVFRDEDAPKFLGISTSFNENDEPSIDYLPGFEMVLLSRQNREIEKSTGRIFPGLQIKHGVGILLEMLRREALPRHTRFLCIHFMSGFANVLLFTEGGLKLANCIEVRYLEDLQYYLLFMLKKFSIDHNITYSVIGDSSLLEKLKLDLGKYLPNQKSFFELISQPRLSSDSFSPETHALGLIGPQCA